jgi:glycosyltransferase involved in cell wall biosynthesis
MDPMPLRFGYPSPSKVILGLRNEFLYKEHKGGAKGLYNDGFPGRSVSLNRCAILHMVNKNQMNVFRDVVLNHPLVLCQHGVDIELFNKDRYTKVSNDVLTIGVSGRDSTNKSFGVIKSACNKLGLRFLSAQYGSSKVPKEKMPEFYNKIDVYVCFSKSEGLHNGTMESGCFCVPVVSTKCGGSEEMIQDKVSGLLIERNEQSLIDALETMKNKELRESMGNEFYKEIMTNWTWEKKVEDYRKMFNLYFEKFGG